MRARRRRLWNAAVALGQPVTVEAEAKVEMTLPGRTVDIARLATQLGVPIENGLLNVWWQADF